MQVRPVKTKVSLVQNADEHRGPEIFHGAFSAVKVFKTWVGSSHGVSWQVGVFIFLCYGETEWWEAKSLFVNLFIFISWVGMFYLYVCVCTTCMLGAFEVGQIKGNLSSWDCIYSWL